MNDSRMPDVARYWAGLAILERLSGGAPGLTSEEVRTILGARSVKGIGAALSGTRLSLRQEGIRLDEALVRRQVRGRSVWSAGVRIRQARHALEHARRMWTRRERGDRAPLDEAPPGVQLWLPPAGCAVMLESSAEVVGLPDVVLLLGAAQPEAIEPRGVDLDSGYLFGLSLSATRDGEAWAGLLREGQAQGLGLSVVVKDAARGIAAEVSEVFPHAEQRDDCFHVLYEMNKVRGRLERRAYSAIEREGEALGRLGKIRAYDKERRRSLSYAHCRARGASAPRPSSDSMSSRRRWTRCTGRSNVSTSRPVSCIALSTCRR